MDALILYKNEAKKRYEAKLEAVQLKNCPYRLSAEFGIDDTSKY